MKKPTLKSLLRSLAIVVVALAVVLVIIKVKAGTSLDPTGPPTDEGTRMDSLGHLYCKLTNTDCPGTAPSLDPPGAPGSDESKMHTIKDVYDAAPNFKDNPGTATASDVTCGEDAWADKSLVSGTGCLACKECSAGSCDNMTNNTQDTTDDFGFGTCDGTCQACQSGSCGVADAVTDPGEHCGTTECLTGDCKGGVAECDYYTDNQQHNCDLCYACDGTGTCTTDAAEGYGCGETIGRCVAGHCCYWKWTDQLSRYVVSGWYDRYCNWENKDLWGALANQLSGDRVPGTVMWSSFKTRIDGPYITRWKCTCEW